MTKEKHANSHWRWFPWYGLANLETDEPIITGSNGGDIKPRTAPTEFDDVQFKLWDAGIYATLTIGEDLSVKAVMSAKRLRGRTVKEMQSRISQLIQIESLTISE